MGAVKIEIKKDHEWNNVSLNNVEIIEFLIKFRWKFDDNYICKNLYTNDVTKSNGIPDFYEGITCLYADLDIYIKNTNLHKIERIILKLLMMGFDFEEISEFIKEKKNKDYKSIQLKYIFKHSCKKILSEYKYNYEFWLHTSSNKKIKQDIKYKICSKCKKSYEKTIKYYPKREKSYDGFDYICRNCVRALVQKAEWKKKQLLRNRS